VTRVVRRLAIAAFLLALVASARLAGDGARGLRTLQANGTDPIAYTVRIADPDSHFLEVEASVPADGRSAIELMMPTWSPGYYRVERYAERVDRFAARDAAGHALAVEMPKPNRWRVQTGGVQSVVVSYRVFCNQQSVTTNYVGGDYAVLNGAPTFVTLAGAPPRPHDVRLDLPPRWSRAMTGLDEGPDRQANHFRASDYETLVDSPIIAGNPVVREFRVADVPHYLVGIGEVDGWDADAAARDLARYVAEVRRFWGFLPYTKYDFLLAFRRGGGGLEHKNSTLSTVAVRPGSPWPAIGLLAHEYFHLFNVKRLRPIELGPFDFEHPPSPRSLWIAEGVTSYYSELLLERSGLRTRDDYFRALSRVIGELQHAPGRLLQSVEQSSLDVWNNSNSGVSPNASTVSYYTKGHVLGLLLDAKIRRATDGRRSLDDVMRSAYERFGGARGYTPDDFRGVAEAVAGVDLREWFRANVASAQELSYDDLLECFGLRFIDAPPGGSWTIELRPDQTSVQARNMNAWLTGRTE
jgi:predicted metalloprotease with PDZ domain